MLDALSELKGIRGDTHTPGPNATSVRVMDHRTEAFKRVWDELSAVEPRLTPAHFNRLNDSEKAEVMEKAAAALDLYQRDFSGER